MPNNTVWERACVITGVWKKGGQEQEMCETCSRPHPIGDEWFDIPCPPVGDPATGWKMLAYFMPHATLKTWELMLKRVRDHRVEVWDALAAAIVALKEKQK
jgi:hypothetical protein